MDERMLAVVRLDGDVALVERVEDEVEGSRDVVVFALGARDVALDLVDLA